ncbi:MAG TPA: DUF5107 domain-containing protein [Sedimentisphaerales bacterium]|nr:DUF5107 domain-containing protein [Sedimentisphaerales bacterium]
MRALLRNLNIVAFVAGLLLLVEPSWAKVKAWEGTVTIPTYGWAEDVNPKLWALESQAKFSITVKGSIVYPYTMQDHLYRTKQDRTYKALFLENEYLKVTCLPELGGRLHSVFDKTQGKEMFHYNSVIKPGMIAMRGAWISGGVEWNAGPQGHTVTILSPVDALIGTGKDGSAYLEISNLEKTQRTRWTARVTLHPGKAYLDEQIRIFNPTDAVSPYYFWNCTAFPNRPGTRFIYPMTLGTDHSAVEFFSWPIHNGKDLSWLKNYETYASIFSVDCVFDFFGAYDVDADRGIIQAGDHHKIGGKKAWTWGTWEFGLVSQQSLTDDGAAYIEVQTGPLPTQSDYGMLLPREEVSWREYWYPVHGLGDGFEYATKDIAVQTTREKNKLQLRLLATSKLPGSVCILSMAGQEPLQETLDLSPAAPTTVTLLDVADAAVSVTIKTNDGDVLAAFDTPLPIPKVYPPQVIQKPDEELSVEEKFLKGRKHDLATNRKGAREYYAKALADDPQYSPALRALAVLDFEAGLYEKAIEQLEEALERDASDGLSWYFLGASRLKLANAPEALRCAYRAARCLGTASLGYDLAGRAYMSLQDHPRALDAFRQASSMNPTDAKAANHLLLATYAAGNTKAAYRTARQRVAENPTDLVPRALQALQGKNELARFVRQAGAFVGEDDFEMIETALVFADLGLVKEAARLLEALCVHAVPQDQVSPIVLYYLAYLASLQSNVPEAEAYLDKAGKTCTDYVFPSRPESVEIFKYALAKRPDDAYAHLHIGNLFGHLGRLEEAADHWAKAAELDQSLSVAFRNLGLYAWTVEQDLHKAEQLYRKAIAARPKDQTLYRDLADILLSADKRPEAVKVLESAPFEKLRRADVIIMLAHLADILLSADKRPEAVKVLESTPSEKLRRADVIIMLAQGYVDEQRYGDAIDLLESTPYFVNWEGQTITWDLFNKAHIERGRERLKNEDYTAALQDFEAALTYPDNIGVGRSNKPPEAPAQYWRGKALQGLERIDDARSAWKQGATGPERSGEQNEYRELCKKALADAPTP